MRETSSTDPSGDRLTIAIPAARTPTGVLSTPNTTATPLPATIAPRTPFPPTTTNTSPAPGLTKASLAPTHTNPSSAPTHTEASFVPTHTNASPAPNDLHAPVAPPHQTSSFLPSNSSRVTTPPDRTPVSVLPPGESRVPDDLYVPEDLDAADGPDAAGGPRFVSEQDQLDAELDDLLGRNRYCRVDDREWEEWHGVDQDEAERALLRREAPAWVFLPPGGDLAAAVEDTRPRTMSPMALIELLKAAARLSSWVEAVKAEAMASFYRQRHTDHATSPRPPQCDGSGRPIDPERSWHAEIALALGLSPQTVARRVTTALRLTGPLSATHTALKCGALTHGKALAICEATTDLPDQATRAVETHVLKRATTQTHANLLRSLRTQVAKHRTTQDTTNHRAAVADRTCKIVPLPNGMAGLWIVHTADKIQQIWVTIQALTTLAKRHTPTAPADPAAADPAAADPAPTDTPRAATTPAATSPADTTDTDSDAGTTRGDTTSTATTRATARPPTRLPPVRPAVTPPAPTPPPAQGAAIPGPPARPTTRDLPQRHRMPNRIQATPTPPPSTPSQPARPRPPTPSARTPGTAPIPPTPCPPTALRVARSRTDAPPNNAAPT